MRLKVPTFDLKLHALLLLEKQTRIICIITVQITVRVIRS